MDHLTKKENRHSVHECLRKIKEGQIIIDHDLIKSFYSPEQIIKTALLELPIQLYFIQSIEYKWYPLQDILSIFKNFIENTDNFRDRIFDKIESKGEKIYGSRENSLPRIEDYNMNAVLIHPKCKEIFLNDLIHLVIL